MLDVVVDFPVFLVTLLPCNMCFLCHCFLFTIKHDVCCVTIVMAWGGLKSLPTNEALVGLAKSMTTSVRETLIDSWGINDDDEQYGKGVNEETEYEDGNTPTEETLAQNLTETTLNGTTASDVSSVISDTERGGTSITGS